MEQVLGWAATILFNLNVLPQLVKSIRTQKVGDISIVYWWVGWTANIIAWIYAFMIWQKPLIFKYTMDWLTITTYIIVFYRIQHKCRKSASYTTPGRTSIR